MREEEEMTEGNEELSERVLTRAERVTEKLKDDVKRGAECLGDYIMTHCLWQLVRDDAITCTQRGYLGKDYAGFSPLYDQKI